MVLITIVHFNLVLMKIDGCSMQMYCCLHQTIAKNQKDDIVQFANNYYACGLSSPFSPYALDKISMSQAIILPSSDLRIRLFLPASDLPVIQLPSPMCAWPVSMFSLTFIHSNKASKLSTILSLSCLLKIHSSHMVWMRSDTWLNWFLLLCLISMSNFSTLYSFSACSMCTAASKARAKLNSKRNI